MRISPLALCLISAGLVAQQAPVNTPVPAQTSATATAAAVPAAPAAERRTITIPAGTTVPLALKHAISTKNARAGDPVYAATTFPVTLNDRIVIPPGTFVQGVVSEVKRAGRVKGRAELLVHFRTMIFPSGYTIALPGAVERAPDVDNAKIKDEEGTVQADSQKGKDAGTIVSTAGTGAVIGGLSRGGKGALIGGGIGGAIGTAIALLGRGDDVRLESGSTLDMVFQRPVTLDESKLSPR